MVRAQLGEHLETVKNQLVAGIPAGCIGQPQEIAKAMVYLTLDESLFVIGNEILVDGGSINLARLRNF